MLANHVVSLKGLEFALQGEDGATSKSFMVVLFLNPCDVYLLKLECVNETTHDTYHKIIVMFT